MVGYKIDNEILPEEVPEQRLWKAVIDRALRDYVHFYRISLGFSYPFPKTDTKSLFKHYRAAPVQFKCLVWFLFEPTEPHNLEYLVDEFYECDGLVERIRNLARDDFTKEKQEILTVEWAKPLVEKYRRMIERKEQEEGKKSILRLLFY